MIIPFREDFIFTKLRENFRIYSNSDDIFLNSFNCVSGNMTFNTNFQGNVGHFGHRHFGLGHFSPDISATNVSAKENAKGGRFGPNHKLWVGVRACINV